MRRFETLVVRLAGAFVRVTVDKIDIGINRWLKRIVIALGLDRSTIAEINPATGRAVLTHGWAREADRIIGSSLDANALLPWTKQRMLAGETVIMQSPHLLPPEAAVDRETFLRHGPKSNVIVPVKVGGTVFGAVAFGSLYRERSWPPKIVRRLQTVAQIFGYALERKRRVSELIRLQGELTYISRVTTMGELAASIAHELNQPLAAILSNAEAIQNILASDRPDLEEVSAGIGDIIQDDNRASEAIRRLRSLFRRDDLIKSAVDLPSLLAETSRIVEDEALSRDIIYSANVKGLLPPVFAERVQLQQAIINLILNAFDAVGEMSKGLREVQVTAIPDGAEITILVRDSGNGIPPEAERRIFDAFFTTKSHGMGMGLAIAKSIVDAHGGRLSFSPNSDRGTTFAIRLPIAAGLAC
jgi:signal transduction histidine kinase